MFKKIMFAVMICFGAMSLTACDRVEPGYVGIKVNRLGDDKGVGEVVGVGRQWTGWNTELYTFPTFKQMKTYDEPFTFQMSDGTTIDYGIGVAYSVDPTKVTNVFQTYRKGTDDITNTDLRQKISDGLNRLSSRMSTDKFIDGGKADLLDAVLKEIQLEMNPVGINVVSLSWTGKPLYPEFTYKHWTEVVAKNPQGLYFEFGSGVKSATYSNKSDNRLIAVKLKKSDYLGGNQFKSGYVLGEVYLDSELVINSVNPYTSNKDNVYKDLLLKNKKELLDESEAEENMKE